MRAIWKGAVSFGLVSIGVKVYSATEEKDIRFHQVHREDGGRIRYKRTCQVCGEEVTYDDIAKGYDIGGGEMVILTDEDFADLPLTTSHAIDVLEFVPAEQVDPILYNKAYFLEPEGSATKPYVLLRDALADSERVAIVKVALRQREQLATLRVREGVLLLNTMLWPDEVRQPDFGFLDEDLKVRPPELAMASSLIDSMAGEFEPDAFTDDYRAALQEVIDAKIEGREVVQPEEEEAAPAAAVDLMAALKASVERARAARGEAPAGGGAEPTPISAARSAQKAAKKAPAKKAAEQKAPAKKAPAKKTAEKKAAAKKAEPAKKSAAKKAPAKKAAEKKAAPRKTA
ncbi:MULTISPECIES: Ku protein [Micromonospora]|uniref:Non-homologous end joining protein Ku n=1 Tax=Micromonospora solifontis TaxID=2487138 RepID=A0ABX9WN60_9ACTN|nr:MULTISPECIES: Ku protein [Micromonospora]NES13205.1 Ku protein [Micromonospora sp. PPF5-17B]NES34574.1 Ku protein [Micromonospora solifontis]NES57062.1 Ku protein [Micromonospora sp. PPF5-6]RNM01829.1 Ku protein [Micromonospora solifontis]